MFSEISLNGTPKPILRLTLWLKACDFYPRCLTFTNFRPVSHLSFDLRISLFFSLFLCRGCFKKVSPTFRFTSKSFHSQNLELVSALQLSFYYLEEFCIGSNINPLIDVLLYSHHLSPWYCIDIVRRNSVLVIPGSERVYQRL